MKLRLERDLLANAVAWAMKGVAAKPPTPVLAGLRLTADAGALSDGSLTVTGFDYETSAKSVVPADVVTPGTVLVSGRLLADIVKNLPARPVDVVVDGSRVLVQCGSAKFRLLTMPQDDYPTLPHLPAPVGRIPADVFSGAVAQVAVAASRDESLPILTSVRVEVDGPRVTLMATDRYRLAMRELEWEPVGEGVTAGILVRSRSLADVAKALVPGTTVGVGYSDGIVGFDAGSRVTTSLLIDGEYPKVRALFPASASSTAVVSVSGLADAVRRMALVAERNMPVRCTFTDGTLTLEAGQGEDASGVETLDAVVEGDVPVSAFNPQFLLDGVLATGAPFVRLSFTAPGKPAVLTGQAVVDGDDDPSYRYLLMPVRLNNA